MESWNSTWVPSYRLIAGPVRQPERHELRQMIQEDIDDQRCWANQALAAAALANTLRWSTSPTCLLVST
jgi:hypothetical protein